MNTPEVYQRERAVVERAAGVSTVVLLERLLETRVQIRYRARAIALRGALGND